MEEKDFIEPNEETRARGVKRSSEIKIAEVTISKKKRSKKPPAESPEPVQVEINFNNQENNLRRASGVPACSRPSPTSLFSVEELTVALNHAVRSR